MKKEISSLIAQARISIHNKDWDKAYGLAAQIINENPEEPEGYFLQGLAWKAAKKYAEAIACFQQAYSLNSNRYDAAIEQASLLFLTAQHRRALDILRANEEKISSSPVHLDMAGTTYERLGLHATALKCFLKAHNLQPDIAIFREHLATSNVNNGKVQDAISLLEGLLKEFPKHQRNHFELSRIRRASDEKHIIQMKNLIETNHLPPSGNIFYNYAIGKELEDLGKWDEAFSYYKDAGDAASKSSNYDVKNDISLIHKIIDACSKDWISSHDTVYGADSNPTPIFIVGLPRTGSTLLERCLSGHSDVESAGETFFIQQALVSIAELQGPLSEAVIEIASNKSPNKISEIYFNSINYRLSGLPFFIDKLPENYMNLGFIAKSMPKAKIIVMNRHPLDACFAQYKQSFFRYAYNLDDLGRYYIAYTELLRHWRDALGERLIEVNYEDLVLNTEKSVSDILQKLGLDFEKPCLAPEENRTPISTASSAQVVEKIHTRSLYKWKNFSKYLTPLQVKLESAGIKIE